MSDKMTRASPSGLFFRGERREVSAPDNTCNNLHHGRLRGDVYRENVQVKAERGSQSANCVGQFVSSSV